MATSAVAMGICLALASSLPSVDAEIAPTNAEQIPEAVFLKANRFTLAWTHSIEKQRWEEDYDLVELEREKRSARLWLRPLEARIKGSGAGMEPPEGSRLINGWFVYRPTTAPLTVLRLSRSFFTDDYSLCIESHCNSMANLLPSDGQTTLLWGCRKNSPLGPP